MPGQLYRLGGRKLVGVSEMKKAIFVFLLSVSFSVGARAAERLNHFGLDLSIGEHRNAGPVDDLKTHRATVEADQTITDRSFSEDRNLSFGVAAVFERSITRKDRIGFRLGWESIGLGSLTETYPSDLLFPLSGTHSTKYSVNGSHRFLSAYYRRLFFERFHVSPFIGGGISHMRAKAVVEQSGVALVTPPGALADDYRRSERWIPHAIFGVDFFLKGPNDIDVGWGFNAEYFFNAKFSGFRTDTEELKMVNGKLVSVPIGSPGRSFEADFTGFLFSFVAKVLY